MHPGVPVKTMNARSAKAWKWPGLDIRGDGGYAIAAGANQTGPYVQLRDFADLDQFDSLPEELRRQVLSPTQKPETALEPTRSHRQIEDRLITMALNMVSRGDGRNNAGFHLACQLRDNGYSKEDAFGVIHRYAAACPATNAKGQTEPYGESEISATLDSAYSAGAREPWGPNGPVTSNGGVSTDDSPSLPIIQISNRQLRDPTLEALAALIKSNDPPFLFVQSGNMVAVVRNELGRLTIKRVDDRSLRRLLTEAADFARMTEKGPRNAPPPMNVVQTLLALAPASWGLQPLDGIVEAPVLRADGSVLDKEGYDVATRLYYSPDPNLTIPAIPDNPTRDQIEAAKLVLLEPLRDFPFEDEASRANALAALLTPTIKPAIMKPTPLGAISARAAGTGKSLLAELIARIHTGRPAEMLSAPKDPDEWRKQISTALISGSSVIVFDNISDPLDSPELCKALTADIYGDRVLRTYDPIRIAVCCVWFATGNNILLRGDMPRRCYWIRMDAKMATPFLRSNFAHPNLKDYVTSHRGEILAALLTLARGWFTAGKPRPAITPLGTFEDWTITVGGILAHAGIEGFLGNSLEAYEQADTESIEWLLFLSVLHEVFSDEPFKTSQVWGLVRETIWSGFRNIPTAQAQKLIDALPETLLEAQEKQALFVRRLGRRFAELENRRFGANEIYVTRGKIAHKVQEWLIQWGFGPPA
jgi:hypothetical protein